MLVLAVLAVALLLAFLSGGRFKHLMRVRLRFESAIAILLVADVLLPVVLSRAGIPENLGAIAWSALVSLFAALAFANARMPGLGLIGFGIGLNAAAVLLNDGMPLSTLALAASGFPPDRLSHVSTGGYLHPLLGPHSKIPILADVIPVSLGRAGGVVSLGDILLFVGVVVFIVGVTRSPLPSHSGGPAKRRFSAPA